ALLFDPSHHKATLRRGFALARLKRWGLASKDLSKAVETDASDKKAQAELQMVKRMLAEQAKEARAHAKCAMIDPTRSQTMPSRRLVVKVRRPGSHGEDATAAASAAKTQAPGQDSPENASPKPSAGPAVRQPYIPRSVRLRGRQPAAGATLPQAEAYSQASQGAGGATGSSSRATGGYPGVTNFYSFEAQWKRLRGKPLERAALLQKIGANSLPALLRESLDGELVASITEAILIDMSGDREGGGPASATFAAEAMQALARTPRFDLSLHCLSKEERKIIEQVLEILDGQSTACSKAGKAVANVAMNGLKVAPASVPFSTVFYPVGTVLKLADTPDTIRFHEVAQTIQGAKIVEAGGTVTHEVIPNIPLNLVSVFGGPEVGFISEESQEKMEKKPLNPFQLVPSPRFDRDVSLNLVENIAAVKDLAPVGHDPFRSKLCAIEEGAVVMKLSGKSSAQHSMRAAKRLLEGDEEKAAVEELEVNALGHAIPHAVAVGEFLEEKKLGKVVSIRTGLQEVPGTGRHCPLIVLTKPVV
ncbi:unnamed protein product, partial [Polarella glacialis]